MTSSFRMKDQDAITEALRLFGLTPPVSQEQLDQKRHELLATWQPHRYANLTNNPRKYMQMYKKAEAMTKDIQAAYDLLSTWLSEQEKSGGSQADKLTR